MSNNLSAQQGKGRNLWNALGDTNSGFFLNIGHLDLDDDAITKPFLRAGWQWINIQWTKSNHAYKVTFGTECGCEQSKTFCCNLQYRDLTSNSIRFTRQKEDTTNFGVFSETNKTYLDILSINSIIENCAANEVHFLKAEFVILKQDAWFLLDLLEHRPWIILVEGEDSCSPESGFLSLEQQLFINGYLPTAEEGIYKYYVAVERFDLAKKLISKTDFSDQSSLWNSLDISREMQSFYSNFDPNIHGETSESEPKLPISSAFFRYVFHPFRTQSVRLQEILCKFALKKKFQDLHLTLIQLAKRTPIIAVLNAKLKHRFPIGWKKITNIIRWDFSVTTRIPNNVTSDSMEEAHFLNLFLRGIAYLRKGSNKLL